jgi:hypothetical protein
VYYLVLVCISKIDQDSPTRICYAKKLFLEVETLVREGRREEGRREREKGEERRGEERRGEERRGGS